jgi:hypothetical protein
MGCKWTVSISQLISNFDIEIRFIWWQDFLGCIHMFQGVTNKQEIWMKLMQHPPVTVVEQSKACTVFVRSEAGIVGSNPTQGMDGDIYVCVCGFFFMFVTSWSPAQGVLPNV